MKKLLITVLLLLPFTVFGASVVPWSTTDFSIIKPNIINGYAPQIEVSNDITQTGTADRNIYVTESASGAGRNLNIYAGHGATNQDGGALNLYGGQVNGSGRSGDLNLTTFDTNGGTAGSIFIGNGDSGAGNPAGITINGGSGNSFASVAPILLQSNGGKVGIGTSSPYSTLSVVGTTTSAVYEATTTATSTFAGGISTNLLKVLSTTASSTFSNGINLTKGCFAINGTCISGGGGSGVTSVATNNGLTGGTITTTGTIGLDISSLSTNALTAWNGSKLVATGTPQLTVGNILATSSATSTFVGPLLTGDKTVALGALSTSGQGSEPSLIANTPALLDIDSFNGASAYTRLVTTISVNSPYYASIQHRHATADNISYPILINPLGGSVGIGMTSATVPLDVGGTLRVHSNVATKNYWEQRETVGAGDGRMTFSVTSGDVTPATLSVAQARGDLPNCGVLLGPATGLLSCASMTGNIALTTSATLLGAPQFGANDFDVGTHKSMYISSPDVHPTRGVSLANYMSFNTFSVVGNSGAGVRPGFSFTGHDYVFNTASNIGYNNPVDYLGSVAFVIASSTIDMTPRVGVGTSTPSASFAISGTSTNPFYISTTTVTAASTTLFMIDRAGDAHLGGGTPTLSSCGTSPSLDANATDQSGTITVGSVSATSCTLTFAAPKNSIPHCSVTSQTGTIAISYTETASALVITNAALTGDKVDYNCFLGH